MDNEKQQDNDIHIDIQMDTYIKEYIDQKVEYEVGKGLGIFKDSEYLPEWEDKHHSGGSSGLWFFLLFVLFLVAIGFFIGRYVF